MKDVTNVLVVLFLIVGAGLVYAGKGVCKSPETTVEVNVETVYDNYGHLVMTLETTSTFYGHMFCSGEEGDCTVEMDPNASSGTMYFQWWMYHSSGEDSEILAEHGEETRTIWGRKVC